MDSTPGLEVYESYEQDYKTIAASISGKLEGEAKDVKGGKWGGTGAWSWVVIQAGAGTRWIRRMHRKMEDNADSDTVPNIMPPSSQKHERLF